MNNALHYMDFGRTCLLNGIGLLVLCAPAVSRDRQASYHFGIGQHFHNVGVYLYETAKAESPLLAEKFKTQEEQLELHLPS